MRFLRLHLVLCLICTYCGPNEASKDVPSSSSMKWQVASLIDNNCGIAYNPQVAIDPNGNGIAVWREQCPPLSQQIYANYYNTNSGWGIPVRVSNNSGGAGAPQIRMYPNGNAIAIWIQSDGTYSSIYSSTYTLGSGWGASLLVENNTGDAYLPVIAIRSNGDAIAIWQQNDGTYTSIYGNYYTSNVGWGAATLVENSIRDASWPDLGINNNGDAVAIWSQSNGVATSIYANYFTVAGGWAGATLLESSNQSAGDPQVAVDVNGVAIAVWRQRDGTYNSIYANQYLNGVGWGSATLIESSIGDAHEPKISFSPNGNAMAAWDQYNGSDYCFFVNNYTANVGWGTASNVKCNASDVDIVYYKNDEAMAAWAIWDGSKVSLEASKYVAASGWSSPEMISNNSASTDVVQIATNQNGVTLAVWGTLGGILEDKIFANQFE